MNDPLRPYRKAFRAWRNTRRLDKEGERYRREFRRRGLSVPSPGRHRPRREGEESRVFRRRRAGTCAPSRYSTITTGSAPRFFRRSRSSGRSFTTTGGTGSTTGRGVAKGLKSAMNRPSRFSPGRPIDRPFHFIFAYLSGILVTPETVERLSASVSRWSTSH